jgi:hypothetical protein
MHTESKPITYLAKTPDERALRAELAEAIAALDARDETFRRARQASDPAEHLCRIRG